MNETNRVVPYKPNTQKPKTVWVSAESWRELDKIKKVYKARSLGEVVAGLIDYWNEME